MPPRRPSSLFALAVLVLVAGCSRQAGPDRESSPSRVDGGGAFRLARVQEQAIERAILVTGSLHPVDRTPVSVKVPGRIESIAVDLGSPVKEGDVIAQLDRADYELRVRQAEAALGEARARMGLPLDGDDDQVELGMSSRVKQARAVLDEARANRQRIFALSGQGILSEAELETATAAFTVAQSRYDEALEEARTREAQLRQRRAEFEIAQKELADTTLRAPFDGAVQERRANQGEYLTTGAPVVVLVRVDPLRLRVEVSEREALRVRVGQSVRVSVEGDQGMYAGQVTRLSPAIAQGSRTLLVEADVPALGRLRPGAFARAQIITVAEAPALTIPPEALVTFAGIEKVFVVEGGRASERAVTTGDRGEGWVEVTSGLRAGESVVMTPGNLQTGQAVRLVSEDGTGASPVSAGS